MLNRSASLAMSTSVLKALPGKLDIKRHSPRFSIPRQVSRCQQAFSKPCLVNLISKDTHLVFSIFQDIDSKVKHTLFTINAGEGLQQYISSVADLCWLLNVQDPPCFIKCGLHRGDKFNDDEYKRYMSSGEEVSYIVWPPMYLFKGGPIISKGVVQAMSTDENAIQDTMETANVISQLHAENKSSKVMETHLHDNPRSEDNLDSGVPGLDSGSDTMTSNNDQSTAIKVDEKLLAIEAQIISSCVSSEPAATRFPTMPIIAIARCKKKAFKR